MPSFLLRHRAVGASLLVAMVVIAFPFQTARALELQGGNINTTDPGTTFNGNTFAQPLPWYNVGQIPDSGGGISSTIFLGDLGGNGEYWGMTAYHVVDPTIPTTATFDGSVTYNIVPGSFQQLPNADVELFQFTANPASLPTLTLQSTSLSVGDSIYYSGFGGGPQRWGYGQVAGGESVNDGYASNTQSFYTYYLTGNPNYALGITGDSGGAAFYYNNTTDSWQLAGMMFAVDDSDSPNSTYSADIDTYYDDIMTVVPEPDATSEFLLGAVALFIAGAARKYLRARSNASNSGLSATLR